MSSFGLNEITIQSLIENLYDLDFTKYSKSDLIKFCNILYAEYKKQLQK